MTFLRALALGAALGLLIGLAIDLAMLVDALRQRGQGGVPFANSAYPDEGPDGVQTDVGLERFNRYVSGLDWTCLRCGWQGETLDDWRRHMRAEHGAMGYLFE